MVLARVHTQIVNCKSVKEGLLNHRCASDIVGEHSTNGLVQLIILWEVMVLVRLAPDQEDVARWQWHEGGRYTPASTHRMLFKGAIHVSYVNCIWRCWASLCCKTFLWLAIPYLIWTSDQRLRHGYKMRFWFGLLSLAKRWIPLITSYFSASTLSRSGT